MTSSPPPDTAELDGWMDQTRRALARLKVLDRALLLTSLGFLAWLVLEVFIRERRDTIYLLLSIYGSMSGLLRALVWKVRAVPGPLLLLAHGTLPERQRAWRLLERHKAELLALTTLPATINEPALETLDRDGLVARVERHGTTNWPRILRLALVIWLVGLALVILAVALHTPEAEVTLRSIRN